ncbi:MAG: Hpt domain-containing protein [Candidatus Aminicenantales bacterium]
MRGEKICLQATEIMDYTSALERTGGDIDFLQELLDLYGKNFDEKKKFLAKAIQEKNFCLIQDLGHSLKGSSANLSLNSLKKASSQLEAAAREKDMDEVKRSFALLEKEFRRFQDFLHDLAPED